MQREVKWLAQSHVANKRQLALELRQPGSRAPFSTLNSKLVRMLDTSICPSRSTPHPFLSTACKLYQQAPLPFGFRLRLASGSPGQEIRGKKSMRETWEKEGVRRGNLRSGCISWLMVTALVRWWTTQGPLSGSWCSHLPCPFKPRGGQVAVTYCTTSVVSLHPAHTFVNSPSIPLSSNYSIWVCHLFPARLWPDINRKATAQRPPSLPEKHSSWVQGQSQVNWDDFSLEGLQDRQCVCVWGGGIRWG